MRAVWTRSERSGSDRIGSDVTHENENISIGHGDVHGDRTAAATMTSARAGLNQRADRDVT